MPRGIIPTANPHLALFVLKKVAKDCAIDPELLLDQWDAIFEAPGHVMPGQTQHLAEANEERRNAAEEKSVIRFVAAACDEGMRQSQAQIAQCLLAEETF